MSGPKSFANREKAEAERDRWKQIMPQVESAYKPSGKLPGMALVVMIAGLPLGAVAGAASGAVVAWIAGWLASRSHSLYESLSEAKTIAWCLPLVLTVIIAFFGYLLTFVAVGAAAAATLAGLGRIGKNRSTGMTALLGAVSALLAAQAFRVVLNSAGASLSFLGEPIASFFTPSGFGLVCLVVGFLIAAVCGAVAAAEIVKGSKFCERCERFMQVADLNQTSFEGSTEVVSHLADGNVAGVSAVLGAARGDVGSPQMFECPACGSGFLELNVKFEAKWPAPKKDPTKQTFESLSASWLVASKSLATSEVETLKAHRKA